MKENSNAILCYKTIICLIHQNSKDIQHKVFKKACPEFGLILTKGSISYLNLTNGFEQDD